MFTLQYYVPVAKWLMLRSSSVHTDPPLLSVQMEKKKKVAYA